MCTPTPAAKAQRIILALLEHYTQEKAAASLGISAATVRRWLEKPEFQEFYRQARRDQYALLRGRAQQAAPSAVLTLLEIMNDKKAGAAVRSRACRSVLSRVNTFRFEAQQATIEIMEQIQKRDIGHGTLPSIHPEAKSGLPVEIEGTARKASASAAKITQIVLAMVQHGNRAKAAIACCMSPITIWRWMQKPEFQEQYRKELSAAYLRAMTLLQHAADMAFSFLERMMKDKDAPASVRRQIADFLLDFASAGVREEQQERTDALTKAAEERAHLKETDPTTSLMSTDRLGSNTLEPPASGVAS